MHIAAFRSSPKNPITFCLMLLCMMTMADAAAAQDRSYSLRAGLTVSTLTDGDYDPLVNLVGALSARQMLGTFFLQTEAMVSSRGASLATEEPFPTVPGSFPRTYSRIRTNATYVDIPLVAGIRVGSAFRPFLYAGFYGGMRFDAEHRFTYSDTGLTTTRRADDLKRFDYGATAGVGGEIGTRFYRMTIDLRATAGLAPVFDGGGDERHRMLMLTAGIVF